MPTASKRRKLSTTPRNASSLPNKARGIDAFTKVSKGSSISKAIIEKNDYVNTIAITQGTNNKKRKVAPTEEDSKAVSALFSADVIERPVKRLPQQPSSDTRAIPETPQKAILSQESPPSLETPTKGARNLLNRFCISAKTPSRSPLGFDSSSSGILESTPEATYTTPSRDLPLELIDLINLHAAFLTALSIHCAHNGTHAPADLRNLCPDVARAWGKRRVTLEDIRKTLGIMNTNIPEGKKDHRISRLSLSDYGHGKICIEINSSTGKAGRIARPVNENLLNEIFVRGLGEAWEEKDSDISLKRFIETLPMEPITTCPSLIKMSPLLAKGQRRLEDLKAGILVKKEAAKEKIPQSSDGKKLTLLERLRAKQLHQSTLPPPPSKAEIARKAALQRVEEVVGVLSILSTSSSIGQQRISFTLPTVLGKLRDSFQTPMSKEEGATCVRLLASEIAPEWVKIVKMGKIEALVVNRDEKPGEEDIKERVRRAAKT
jgi:DNA replication factor Cdt1 C-terminal domain